MATDQASERQTNIDKYRDYFDGDVDAHYAGLTARFVSSDVSSDDAIQKRDVPIENASRIVISRLCGLVPTDASFEVEGDEKLTIELNEWVSGDHHGPGIGLNDWTPEALERLCIDGEFPIKLILRNGVPIGRYVDDYGFNIITDDTNIFKISGYTAEYSLTDEGDDETSEKIIKELITAESNTVTIDGEIIDSETWKHLLGWVPLVLIKRADVIGDKHGRSLMADLIEAQDNINRCNAFINRANKYGAFPMFAPKEDALSPEDTVSLGPGRIPTFPIERISADGASDAIFKEREFWLQHLFALCGLKQTTQDETSQAPNTSGKALLVLNAEGKKKVASILSRLRRGYRQYCQMALALMKGGDPESYNVIVSFPSLDQEDPAAQLERAKFLSSISFDEEALKALGFNDDKINTMMANREQPAFLAPGSTAFDDDDDNDDQEEKPPPDQAA